MQSKAVEGFHSEEQQQAQRLVQQTQQTQQQTQTQQVQMPVKSLLKIYLIIVQYMCIYNIKIDYKSIHNE